MIGNPRAIREVMLFSHLRSTLSAHQLHEIPQVTLRREIRRFLDSIVFLPPVMIIDGARGISEDHWTQLENNLSFFAPQNVSIRLS